MKTKSNVFIVLVILILGFACIFFGGVTVKKIMAMAVDNRGQAPIRTLRITLDKDQRELLFEQCRKFADKHQFQYDLSFYESSGGENFQVWMRRNDIKIIISDVPKSSTEAIGGIYNTNPSMPASSETVDELLDDLKIFLDEIPDIIIIEEK